MPQTGFLVRSRDFVSALTGPWALRTRTLAVFGTVVFVPTMASEFARMTHPDIATAASISFLSVSVTVSLLALVRASLPLRLRSSLVGMLGVLIAVGVLRGLTTTAVVALLRVENSTFLATRLVLGTLSIPLVLAFITLAVERVSTAWERRAATRQAILDTANERERVVAEIAANNEKFFDEIERTLRPAVDDITNRVVESKDDRESIARSIEALAESIIRPLSHTLASMRTPSTPLVGALGARQVDPGRPSLREEINPLFSGITVAMGGASVMVDILPYATAVVAVFLAGLSTWSILRLAQLAVGNRVTTAFRSGIIVAALHSVAWIPAQLFNRAFVFPSDLQFDPTYVGIIATPILGLLYQLIVLGEYSGRSSLARLDATRVDTVLQLSEARRRAWLQQRHIAHTLHSSIQSRILAEARLVRAGSGAFTAGERRQVTATLRSTLDVPLERSPAVDESLSAIHDLIRFWSGMCAIELAVDDAVPGALAHESEATEALNAVVLEIISNAIRHGNATTMTVNVCRASAETIRVTATNNGAPVSGDYHPSLGMSLYDELTAHWDIRNENGVTVEAIIAARGNNSEPAQH